ncbi:MAG: WD40 repeat domain-containing protein [bacterium]
MRKNHMLFNSLTTKMVIVIIPLVLWSHSFSTNIPAANTCQIEVACELNISINDFIAYSFFPSPGKLVSIDQSGELRIWNLETGTFETSTLNAKDPIIGAWFSPDSSSLLIYSDKRILSLYDCKSLQHKLDFVEPASSISTTCFSKEGKLFVCGHWNGNISIWQLETGQLMHVFKGHDSPIGTVALSPNTQLLASGGKEGNNDVLLWDIASGQIIRKIGSHEGNVYNSLFSDNNTLLTSGGDRVARLWDIHTANQLRLFNDQGGYLYGLTISPSGKMLATSDNQSNIKFWDLNTGEVINKIKAPYGFIDGLLFSPDGKYMTSKPLINSRTITVWRLQDRNSKD